MPPAEQPARGLPAGEGGSLDGGCAGRAGRSTPGAEHVVRSAGSATTLVLGPGLLGDSCRELLDSVLPHVAPAGLLLDAVPLTALADRPELLTGIADRTCSRRTPARRCSTMRTPTTSAARGSSTSATARWCPCAASSRHRTAGCRATRPATSASAPPGPATYRPAFVGGLLARGCSPAQAAVWGQHLHAAAGDRLTAGSAGWALPPASRWTSCRRC